MRRKAHQSVTNPADNGGSQRAISLTMKLLSEAIDLEAQGSTQGHSCMEPPDPPRALDTGRTEAPFSQFDDIGFSLVVSTYAQDSSRD